MDDEGLVIEHSLVEFGENIPPQYVYQLVSAKYHTKCLQVNSQTSDSTGLRVYAGAHVLIRFLGSEHGRALLLDQDVVELGCGTGVVGCVCYETTGIRQMLLTDGSVEACEIARLNVSQLKSELEKKYSPEFVDENFLQIEQLLWGDSESVAGILQKYCNDRPFTVAIGCELMYYKTAIDDLLSTVRKMTNEL